MKRSAHAAQRLCPVPQKLRVKPGVADIVAVTEAGAELRAVIFYARVVIGALRHVDAPRLLIRLQLLCRKARRGAKIRARGLHKNARHQPVKPRNAQQGHQLFVCVSRQLFHIPVHGPQSLVLRHHRLQRLIRRDPRQNLPLQVLPLFPALTGVLVQQRQKPCVKRGVQLLFLRREFFFYRFPEIGRHVAFLHR